MTAEQVSQAFAAMLNRPQSLAPATVAMKGGVVVEANLLGINYDAGTLQVQNPSTGQVKDVPFADLVSIRLG